MMMGTVVMVVIMVMVIVIMSVQLMMMTMMITRIIPKLPQLRWLIPLVLSLSVADGDDNGELVGTNTVVAVIVSTSSSCSPSSSSISIVSNYVFIKFSPSSPEQSTQRR